MFWRFSYSTSHIPTLLEKEDVTLEEIMDEEDVLQECKSSNDKLVEYLTKEENLQQLVANVITLPSEDRVDEKDRFKYSSISCELLTCDIQAIDDALISNQPLLDSIYSFLDATDALNPLMASYFAKVVGALISRKTEAFLGYIQSKENFIKLFIRHIDTSAVMDIVLRLLTTISCNELRGKVVAWLKQIGLVGSLVQLLRHEQSSQTHANTAQLLCDIIRISREQITASREMQEYTSRMPSFLDTMSDASVVPNLQVSDLLKSSLLEEIEKPELIDELLEHILTSADKPNCSVTHGIEVLLAILEIRVPSYIDPGSIDQKLEKDRHDMSVAGIQAVVGCCTKRLESIHNILADAKPKIEMLKYSGDKQMPLLGSVRLSLVRLIVRLMSLNEAEFNRELVRLGTVNIILDMLFKYKWNNFLHFQVTTMISNTFNFEADMSPSKSRPAGLADEAASDDADANAGDNAAAIDPSSLSSSSDTDAHQKHLLIEHYLRDCRFIKRLVDAWQEYFDSIETDANGKKGPKVNSVGYIGHLTVISNLIYYNSKEGKHSDFIQTSLNTFVDKELLDQWQEMAETKIAEINKRNSKDLVRNPFLSSLTDSNAENDFVELPNDEKLNKKFLDLQKEMKINCVEDFSLSESQIVNCNPKFSNAKIKPVSFQMDSGDDSAHIFEQICSQRDNMCFAIGGASKSSGADGADEASAAATSAAGGGSAADEEGWVTQEIKFSENYNNIMSSSSSTTSGKRRDDWLKHVGGDDAKHRDMMFDRQDADGMFGGGSSSDNKLKSAVKFKNSSSSSSSATSSSSSSSASSTSSDSDEEGAHASSPQQRAAQYTSDGKLIKKAKKNKRHLNTRHPHKESKIVFDKADENKCGTGNDTTAATASADVAMDFFTSSTSKTSNTPDSFETSAAQQNDQTDGGNWANFDTIFSSSSAAAVPVSTLTTESSSSSSSLSSSSAIAFGSANANAINADAVDPFGDLVASVATPHQADSQQTATSDPWKNTVQATTTTTTTTTTNTSAAETQAAFVQMNENNWADFDSLK